MKSIVAFSLFVVLLASCSKNTFNTKPTVKVDSFGPASVGLGGTFTLKATVTDKEGDLQDSVYLVQKRFNTTTGSLLSVDTTLRFSLKDFGNPVQSKIELDAVFVYNQQVDGTIYVGQDQPIDRYYSIGIIVLDNAGHRSDYVETNKIVLRKT